jgi:hypothetical protein
MIVPMARSRRLFHLACVGRGAGDANRRCTPFRARCEGLHCGDARGTPALGFLDPST